MKTHQRIHSQYFTFADKPDDRFQLQDGSFFGPITLAYETYGELNAERTNAILLFHALSGSHHAAGYNPKVRDAENLWMEENHLGWWDDFIGPGRALDTDRYFVICVNYLGGCYGSTGPGSIDPETGKPYGKRFPTVAVQDVVNTQVRLLNHFGIDTLLAVVGGSLGGMMAMDFATRFPKRARCVIPIASGARATTLQKLCNFEQIFAIQNDPHFRFGDYYGDEPPTKGLMLARMISHKYFVHLLVMEDRARGELVQEAGDLKGYKLRHQIESYMLHQGKKFVRRFDANTYLRIIEMWQHFDLTARAGSSLVEALRPARQHRWLLFSIDSDVCFWPEDQAEIAEALEALGATYQYITVHSYKGHDSFLLEPELFTPHISFMLREAWDSLSAAAEPEPAPQRDPIYE
ncbi:MAG: homoserine O-acetyltransferase [Candidatus Sumerlaeia bacterium]